MPHRTQHHLFIRNPRLRYFVPEAPAEGAGGGGNSAAGSEGQTTETGYPADTPVAEMTDKQQAAYFRGQSRKQEQVVKAYGLTPQQVKDLQAENETLKSKTQTADEKAVEDAKKAGRAEVLTELVSERVDNAFEKALAGRVPDLAAYREVLRHPEQFAKENRADTEAIKTWVEEHSTEVKGAGQQQRHVADLGQGRRDGIQHTPGSAGKAEAARRFGEKKQQQ